MCLSRKRFSMNIVNYCLKNLTYLSYPILIYKNLLYIYRTFNDF